MLVGMSDEFAMTAEVRRVLDVFLRDANRHSRYGHELMQDARLSSGRLYIALARLERAGWVVGEREAARSDGRQPRWCYRLSADGLANARTEHALLRATVQRKRGLVVHRLRPGSSPA
jgi:PadR family transcriptional regulator PadR